MSSPSDFGLSQFSPSNSKQELLYLIGYYLKQAVGAQTGFSPTPSDLGISDATPALSVKSLTYLMAYYSKLI